MNVIRSFIFTALFVLWTGFLCTVLIPLTWFGHKQASFAGRAWAWGIIWMLRVICGITHKVEGLENLPRVPCVIASKHQSAWDTMIFFALVRNPVFVLKKELLKVPLFGSFMLRMGMVPVDRAGGASALKKMLADVKQRLAAGMSLVVFPEGTRTDVGQVVKYHPGIASIYNDPEGDFLFVPVALNSGKCWDKKSFIKKPGVITVHFLPPIKKGMDRKEFMVKLSADIEKACAEM